MDLLPAPFGVYQVLACSPQDRRGVRRRVVAQGGYHVFVPNFFGDEKLPRERGDAVHRLIHHAAREGAEGRMQEPEGFLIHVQRPWYAPLPEEVIRGEDFEYEGDELVEGQRLFAPVSYVKDPFFPRAVHQTANGARREIPGHKVERGFGIPRERGYQAVVKELKRVVHGVVLRNLSACGVRDGSGDAKDAPGELRISFKQKLLRGPLGAFVVVGKTSVIERGLRNGVRTQARGENGAQKAHPLQRIAARSQPEQFFRSLDIDPARGHLIDVETGNRSRVDDPSDRFRLEAGEGELAGQVSPLIFDPPRIRRQSFGQAGFLFLESCGVRRADPELKARVLLPEQ